MQTFSTQIPKKINTVGVSKTFTIQTNYTPLLRGNRDSQTPKAELKKYEYSMTTSLSLSNYHDSIYTKMITIVPKYVLVNHMKSPLEVSQVGCKANYITIEPKMKREWCWFNHTQPEKIIIKKSRPDRFSMSSMTSSRLSSSVGSVSDKDAESNSDAESN
mmetsp:Transcript_38812/g.28113  ORF Transcript_38812/g.28113 Transcript_38812/m.28113 type:complete len:160 (-) Transcript_38812:242-721(-)